MPSPSWTLRSFALCLILGVGPAVALPSSPPPPNIGFILIDDVGPEVFGCYGGTSYETPNINKLAGAGIQFTRAYPLPSCTPTRTAVMTGRNNVRNYVDFMYCDPNERTFGNLLQAAGYETCVAGKWQMRGNAQNPELKNTGLHPTGAGFDEWCLWQVDEAGSRYWDPEIEKHNVPLTTYTGQYGPDIFNDFVVDFIDRNQHQPFFVYYPMTLGHSPFIPPPGFSPGSNKANDIFPGMVTYMDDLVGNVLRKLKDTQLLEDTLVVLATDNGTNHEIISEWHHGAQPGMKSTTREVGLRMPLLAYWKGVTPRGLISDQLIDFTDLFPTFCEVAGILPPPDRVYDGVSFLPTLESKVGKERDWIFNWTWARPDRNYPERERRWVVTRDWKLYARGEFFHILSDPNERHDLSQTTNQTVLAAKAWCQSIMDGHPERPPRLNG